MEPIQDSLKQWAQRTNLEERLRQMKEELLTHPLIHAYLQEHDDISDEMIEQGLVKLYDFRKEQMNCEQCPGLQRCPNMMKGYEPHIVQTRGVLDLHYQPCQLEIEDRLKKKQQQLIKSLYVPKEVIEATFETLDQTKERESASRAAISFALNANPGEDGQGLFISGQFGVGKTYLMGAVMNALKDRGIESMIVYTPDFFQEMRQAIGNGTFQEKIDMVKKVKVLILDDIGAETITDWIRDDVLGVILQHRMLEKLPTLFTSNFDYDELEKHLSQSTKNGIEELKALRVMERIRHFTTFVPMTGDNRRKRTTSGN